MTLLRQYLVKVRSWYYKGDLKKILRTLLIILVGATAVGLALDFLAPFTGLWNVARSVILLPTAFSAFTLGYMFALWNGNRMKANDRNWVPLRERYSPRRRLQFVVIGGAVLVVGVYALAAKPGYTLIASLIVAAAAGLAAFARKTLKETNRTELGLPDARDANYHRVVEQAQAKRNEKQRERERNKKVRRERILRGGKAADDLEKELLAEED